MERNGWNYVKVGQTGPGRNQQHTAAGWRGGGARGLVYLGQGQETIMGGCAELGESCKQGETKDGVYFLSFAGCEHFSLCDAVWSPG